MARYYARILTVAACGAAIVVLAAGHAGAQTIDRYAQAVTRSGDGSMRMALDLRAGGDGTPIPTPREAAGAGSLVAAAAPHGSQRITYRFVNLTGAAISGFEASLALPAGFELAAIDVVEPAVTDATVTLPYTVGQRDGRTVIGIAQHAMPPGAVVALTFRTRPATTDTTLIFVLAALAAAYLLWFRDLVARDPHLHASAPAR